MRIVIAAALLAATSCAMPSQMSYAGYATTAPIAHKNGVHEEVIINASAKVVWKSMQEQRKLDPDSAYVKALTQSPGEALVEQKFVFPSPFGDAECILHLNETTAERVDFKMISSEDLKAMEGSWVLTPTDDGHTKLSLSIYVEPNMMLPRIITNGIVSHRTKRNLSMVKKLAESASPKSM